MTMQILTLIAQLCYTNSSSSNCQINMTDCYMSRYKIYNITMTNPDAGTQALTYCILAGKTK